MDHGVRVDGREARGVAWPAADLLAYDWREVAWERQQKLLHVCVLGRRRGERGGLEKVEERVPRAIVEEPEPSNLVSHRTRLPGHAEHPDLLIVGPTQNRQGYIHLNKGIAVWPHFKITKKICLQTTCKMLHYLQIKIMRKKKTLTK